MFVVDASVCVASWLTFDRYYESSRDWLDSFRNRGQTAFSPTFLLAEIAGAVVRRTGRAALARRAVMHVESLPEVVLISLDDELVRRAAWLAIEHRLTGADAVYLALAEALDVPFVTWDMEALQRAGSRARTPVEAD